MAVHFDLERMNRAIDAHTRWWNGTLDRPLVNLSISDAHAPFHEAAAPVLHQSNCTDFSWSPEQVIDALDAKLSRYEFLGDSFPMVNFDSFGPGVLSAFCGAKLDNSSGAVWFWPDQKRELADIHVKYNPDNVWVRRIKDIYRAGLERWNGTVIMGLPDLGGVMDVAAVFRGSEDLLMDLYDDPDEVLRLNREIQDAWYEAYADLTSVLKPQGAISDWSRLLSREPSYIIQCDFCYMIGNPMFREFVLDSLREDTERLTHTIYHMDGVGELNHFDDLLALDKLTAIQWQPGAGNPSPKHWMDIFRKIRAAGKQMMVLGQPDDFLAVLDELHGSPYAQMEMKNADRDYAMKILSAR